VALRLGTNDDPRGVGVLMREVPLYMKGAYPHGWTSEGKNGEDLCERYARSFVLTHHSALSSPPLPSPYSLTRLLKSGLEVRSAYDFCLQGGRGSPVPARSRPA
jgi:hypothetical protein